MLKKDSLQSVNELLVNSCKYRFQKIAEFKDENGVYFSSIEQDELEIEIYLNNLPLKTVHGSLETI